MRYVTPSQQTAKRYPFSQVRKQIPPLSTSTPSPAKGKRCMRPHRLLATRRSLWWLSAIWTGTTIWRPGIVRPLSKNADPCTGGADDYPRLLTEESIPSAEKESNGVSLWRGLAGHSLAGLFALYAIYQTDLFSGVGSVSGSLWFSGINEYLP